ncbi:MAG: hypothetical protein KDE52_00265 [Calditrichaeota bacterium]|nr:hypothetical protein [Calditrichota bacterium]MCB0268544.1 hypothetical protein [Calditrichota bacterium]MCB0286127.1 hypothetical protein [Calditrichota bacterium]MCB0298452.1 hypothetical protein [Calditrichota bacterium]MCB9067523.1 hypothetical protein [Calditrichia bacterium]
MEKFTELTESREMFYKALDDKSAIEPAIERFGNLAKQYPAIAGRMKTYTGALVGLKAKYAFWPQDKLSYVNDGLKLLDEGLEKMPDDLETLFIHGTACHYLPSFIGRGAQAAADFEKIVHLLPSAYQSHDPELIEDILKFFSKEKVLSGPVNEKLLVFKQQMKQ